jgi:hypothetical protein
MSQIGNIAFGGHGIVGQLGKPIVSAVAFDLSQPSLFDYIYTPSGEQWEIELKSGQSTIIVRTPDHVDRLALLAHGLEQAQRCLDLIAFESNLNILVQKPSERHIVLFRREAKLVLQHVAVSNLGVSFSARVIMKDKDGNVIPSASPPPPVWIPGLRFYRISQTSQDLYEAYRNLFLGFEALLDAFCPKQPQERERDWLLKAVRLVGDTVNLSQFVPSNCTDPPAYIIGTQYDHIRCRLFHAKPSTNNMTLDIPEPEAVASAYERLVRIWRQIAQDCFSVRGGGNGGMTYVGFRMMMDNFLSQGLTMYFTGDPSPFKKDDEEISPLGQPVFEFQDVQYLSETMLGHVACVGSHLISPTSRFPVIHRIGSQVQGSLLTADCVTEGILLEAVDCFESYQIIRLINRDLPKVMFGLDPS